ncbi:MAG TPA: UvrD-helicase domain-containing protein [Pseudomonadales bacterium]|nr:UvrD-helicase domain-containing protein [Pseudomonadales bacterium]
MTDVDFAHVTFISAGAGSGKTYRLTEELERALQGGVSPAGVIGTTFTVKAAGELNDRVRERLIRSGHTQLAEQMSQALLGTVHSVCERLLQRFAFELGLSPALNVLGIEDRRLFNHALDEVVDLAEVREMNALGRRMSITRGWQKQVEDIVNRARDNDIAVDSLVAMGADSADRLLAFFPRPRAGEHRAAFANAIETALAAIDPSFDSTAGTAKYLDRLRDARLALAHEDCPWATWISLGKAKATKKSEEHAARVREAAMRYEVHPEFQGDIRRYIELVHSIAARTLGRFQKLKTERGLIDFADMEQLALRALDNPLVAERLQDELELLLVDEFQDTNPMQLALFVKLARFAKRVIFVGDVKQAIYAFRGCDPDLVFATLAGLTRRDARTDVLQSSWRARPHLLAYLNQLFGLAFAADDIEPAEVMLRPERDERMETPAVLQWRAAGDQAAQYRALARGIAQLVSERTTVIDPLTEARRPVRFGDIAILARTNQHVEDIARALQAARVPMKMSLDGLREVPEVCFAKACLRRLTDPSDTLATAEIVAFADGSDAERWLSHRLRHLAAGNQAASWLEDEHPIVKRLAELREPAAYQSPVETVARVLNDVGIREVTAGWGRDAIKAAQRQRNLDAFLNLAVEYEAFCASQHEAATLTGFLFWARDPHSPELDLQPTVTTGDAVHVLTYHRSKGLEWPVVVAADFDEAIRTSLWDVRVELTAQFDVEAPLANRTIRFWPRIFGERTRDIPILDAILDGDDARECERGTASEARRLAYVGMTRARDLLIVSLPARDVRADGWLNAFARPEMLPSGDEFQLVTGDVISTGFASLSQDATEPVVAPYAPRWFEPRTRAPAPLREIVSPSRAVPVDGARVVETIDLGARVAIRGDDMALIGNALHRIIAAELVDPNRADAIERAQAILAAGGAAAFVDATEAVESARRFRAFVDARLRPIRVVAEWPIVHALDNGQTLRGWIDVLVETAEGWVVIDHKSSPRPKRDWTAEALEHSGQIACYRSMVAAAGRPLAPSAWIHFPVGGGMLRLDVGGAR